MDAAGDVLEEDRLAGARGGDDQPALAEADGGEDVDDPAGDLGGVVLELEHGRGVERGRVIERGGLAVFIDGPALDRFDLAEHVPAGDALDQQAGAELQVADHLAGDDQVALGQAQREGGVAELAVLALVGDLEQALDVPVVRDGAAAGGLMGGLLALVLAMALVAGWPE